MSDKGYTAKCWGLRIMGLSPFMKLDDFLGMVDHASGLEEGEAAVLKANAYIKFSRYDDAFREFQAALGGKSEYSRMEAKAMIDRWPTFMAGRARAAGRRKK